MNLHLRAILSEPWAVSESFYSTMQPLVLQMLKGEKVDLTPFANQYKPEVIDHKGFNIGILPIQGAITRADFCGEMGSESMDLQLTKWANDSSISAVLLNINSPGGMVSYANNVASTIANFPKPIIAYGSGNVASAAYWMASQAGKLYASDETDIIGSIGTVLSYTKRVKDGNGPVYEVVSVFADESYDKNRSFEELKNDNHDLLKAEFLNPLNSVFLSTVKSARPKIKPEALHGKVYIGSAAEKMGLIDGIRSHEEVLDELVNAIQNPSTMKLFGINFNSKSKSKMKKNERLSAILGRDVMENEALSAEDNAKITAHLDALPVAPEATTQTETPVSTESLTGSIQEAVSAALAGTTEQLNSITQNINSLTDRVAKIEKKPAVAPVAAAPVTGDVEEEDLPSFMRGNDPIAMQAKRELGL